MIKMKDAIENINSIIDQAEERISEVEESTFEILQSKKSKEKKRMKKYYINYRTPTS